MEESAILDSALLEHRFFLLFRQSCKGMENIKYLFLQRLNYIEDVICILCKNTVLDVNHR